MQQVHALEERIAHAEAWIKSFMKRSALCKKITAIDGVGPIIATAIVAAVGKAKGVDVATQRSGGAERQRTDAVAEVAPETVGF